MKYVKRSLGGQARGSSSQVQYVLESPRSSKGKVPIKDHGDRTICYTLKTIVGGFAQGRETRSARKRYTH